MVRDVMDHAAGKDAGRAVSGKTALGANRRQNSFYRLSGGIEQKHFCETLPNSISQERLTTAVSYGHCAHGYRKELDRTLEERVAEVVAKSREKDVMLV